MSTMPYYPTDLTDAQWTLLVAVLPTRKWRSGEPGRPPCDLRQVLNGIFYLLKTGCQWRMVPREVGKGNTIYAYFTAWRAAGVWARSPCAVRHKATRLTQVLGRMPCPPPLLPPLPRGERSGVRGFAPTQAQECDPWVENPCVLRRSAAAAGAPPAAGAAPTGWPAGRSPTPAPGPPPPP